MGIPFTREGSQVQSLSRPPFNSPHYPLKSFGLSTGMATGCIEPGSANSSERKRNMENAPVRNPCGLFHVRSAHSHPASVLIETEGGYV